LDQILVGRAFVSAQPALMFLPGEDPIRGRWVLRFSINERTGQQQAIIFGVGIRQERIVFRRIDKSQEMKVLPLIVMFQVGQIQFDPHGVRQNRVVLETGREFAFDQTAIVQLPAIKPSSFKRVADEDALELALRGAGVCRTI